MNTPTNTETRTIRVRGSITAQVRETTAREIRPGDVVIFGQTAMSVDSADYVGNYGVRHLVGHSGGLGLGVSAPREEFIPRDEPVFVFVPTV